MKTKTLFHWEFRFHVVGLFLMIAAIGFGDQLDRSIPRDPKAHVIQASSIDTRTFSPQVALPSTRFWVRPENPVVLPWEPNGPANGLRPGGMMPSIRTRGSARFPGASFAGSYPPDLDLAVGTQYVVSTVNSVVGIYSKTDGTRVFQQDLVTFFAGVGNTVNFLYDPKCFYDPIANRYFIVTLEQDDATKDSAFLLAVSASSDPNGTWFRYRVPSVTTVGGVDCWIDYPGFGFNADTICVAGNLFGFNSGPFKGAKINVIPKAPLLSGGSANVSMFTDSNAFTLQPCRTWDSSATVLHSISYQNSTTLTMHAVQNGGSSSPSVVSTTLAVPQALVPTTSITGPGTSVLDSLDGRILTSMEYGGTIVAGHTVQTSASDKRTQVRWYEIDPKGWPASGVNPVLKQSGSISGGAGESYHMPAIAKASDGSIAAVYGRTSTSIMADVLTSGRLSTDANGAMSSGTLVATSAGIINNHEGGRWGDYYGLALDPTDLTTFWGVGEIVSASNHWSSAISSFRVLNPSTTLNVENADVPTGTLVSGTVADLKDIDNSYFNSQSVLYYGLGQITTQTFTFRPTVAASALKSLAFNLNFTGPSKATAQVFVLNVHTGMYELLGGLNVGSGSSFGATLTTNLANYVSTGGVVKFAVKAQTSLRNSQTAFNLQTDRAQVVQTVP